MAGSSGICSGGERRAPATGCRRDVSSLVADRLSKSRIYAGARVPELWLVNLRDDVVEIFRGPDAGAKVYAECLTVGVGEEIALATLPVPGEAIKVRVADLIPSRE